MPLRFSVPFSAVAQYSVRGHSVVSIRSKEVRDALKAGKSGTLANVARAVAETSGPGAILHGVFGPDVIAVPAPGSAVAKADALSVPREICRALLAAGLVGDIQELLARTTTVPKSAFSGGNRPDANRHYETIGITGLPLLTGVRLLVVDDVVTTGRTLLACVSHVQDAFPDAHVSAFAVLRAVSHDDIDSIRHPCQGTIRLLDGGLTGWTQRDP